MVVVAVIPKPTTGIAELASLANWPGLTRAIVAPGLVTAKTLGKGVANMRRRAIANEIRTLLLGSRNMRERTVAFISILLTVETKAQDDQEFPLT